MSRRDLFGAIRLFAPGQKFTAGQVGIIDNLADSFGFPRDDGAPVNGHKQISPKGLALVKEFEGLELKAYPDPGSGGDPWTIGWGHTRGVKKGDVITESQAEAFLREDLRTFERAVHALAPTTTQNQFDALVSFAFNLGEGNLKSSTLLKKHNAGDFAGAKAEFGRWTRASGKVLVGLARRRAAEADLYGS